MLIPRRPEDKSVLKYWLPFGFMRRRLAKAHGMVVHNGRLVSGTPTPADAGGFRLRDLLPLWVVMRLQARHPSSGPAPRDARAESRRLSASLAAERAARVREREALEVEVMRLRLRLREVERLAGPAAPSAPPPAAARTRPVDFGGVIYRRPPDAAWNKWRLMDDRPLEVDMICSLGGDCIAASQQRNRGLRPFSLPFDWCFSDGAEAIRNFAVQLERGFDGFALRENLRPIAGIRFGYKDVATGYNFMHHFHAPLETPGEYERFRETHLRRLRRFHDEIERSDSVLFLLSRTFRLDDSCVRAVADVCRRKWPAKRFRFVLATYNSSPASMTRDGDLDVIRIPRDRNGYDISEKVFEWSFLDNVRFTEKARARHAAAK